ncbi:hypothetical protein [Mesorhizobium sp. LMG17149]|uniref:hypothetical protein n=1 Tax=Mesorhizobium sp. LMG17149 TaxID=2968497 RepID=UPI003558C8F7
MDRLQSRPRRSRCAKGACRYDGHHSEPRSGRRGDLDRRACGAGTPPPGNHRYQGGRQPRMLQEDGRPDLVLVYSGETYNYRELRQQLAGLVHRMNTSSDTEVVLHRPRE